VLDRKPRRARVTCVERRAHRPCERGYGVAVAKTPWGRVLLLVAATGCGTSSGSIGAVLGRDNETQALYVRDVPPGLAAAHAGLLPGDEIVMVEGVYVRDLSAKEVRNRLRGELGSTVELTVIRGREVLRVHVTRTELRKHDIIRPKEEKIVP
jgi:C-terminal processing protease CtpA/Prc